MVEARLFVKSRLSELDRDGRLLFEVEVEVEFEVDVEVVDTADWSDLLETF